VSLSELARGITIVAPVMIYWLLPVLKLLGYRYRQGTRRQKTDMELEKSMVPLIIQVQLYNRIRENAGELRNHIGTFERLYAASMCHLCIVTKFMLYVL